MEVRDLIEKLKTFNEDAEVEIEPQRWNPGRDITDVRKLAMKNVVILRQSDDYNED